MQLRPNNYLREIPSERKKGLTGAIIIHAALLLVMIFVGFKILPPPEFEEGIEINFGTNETGYGLIEPAPVATSAYVPPAPVSSAEEVPLLTQNNEEAPEVRRVDPDAERRRLEQAEAERRRRDEALEAERRRQEEENARRAEQQRQADIRERTQNALAGARNANSESASEGVAGGPGNQGVTTGSPNSNVVGDGGSSGSGVSYDLGGRGSLSLPLPRYNYQEAGRVVVEIRVDREGKVTQANAGIRGSTTLNEDLLKAARDAAMQARFEPKPTAPVTQTGTITYNFILR